MSDETNPFQSPQAAGGYVDVNYGADDLRRWVIPYATGRGRAVWAMALVAMVTMIDLISAGSTMMQIRLLEEAHAGNRPTLTEATANDQRQQLIAAGRLFVFLASAVAFLMWFHRMYRNLPALDPRGTRRLKYSPGWAVGYFFLPILNLFRPYQVMKEIWQCSDPEAARQPDGMLRPRGAPLVGWWWTLWLGMVITSNVAARMIVGTNAIDTLITASWISFVSDLLTAPAGILLILVIRSLTEDQDERNRLLTPAPAAFA